MFDPAERASCVQAEVADTLRMTSHPASAPKLTIALDIDDTISRHPDFFAFLSQSLVQNGHRVLIITFRDESGRDGTEADLADWGIHYDELICWSMETCDLAEVDAWKARLCREHRVDLFFEDDPNVLAYVDDTTVCMQPFNRY